MAVMADFARMPTDRKILTFAVIALLMGLLYYQFAYKSLRAEVTAAQGEHRSKVMQNRKLDGDIPKFEALKAHMTVLRKIITENEQALPTSAELPAFFDTLNRKVVESGVEVKSWKQLNETKVDSFIRVPVEIQMTGTFMQIKKFFASLMPKKEQPAADATNGDAAPAETERIVSIENLTLQDPVVKNHEILLTAHFTAATFRQEDAAPGATPALVPSAPAAPAAPGKPAGAPEKLPPANTPRGAKLRVEDALHKADVRDRNAAGVEEAKTPAAPAPPPAGANRLKGGL